MRIWSIHPKYLDSKGLVALWRETLLAIKVLEGRTKGYQNHPQLIRFRESEYPVQRMDQYLLSISDEASKRGYHFDKEKINMNFRPGKIPVTDGQMAYETKHLLNKLKARYPEKFLQLSQKESLQPHPLFKIIHGAIEMWEKTKN